MTHRNDLRHSCMDRVKHLEKPLLTFKKGEQVQEEKRGSTKTGSAFVLERGRRTKNGESVG